MNVPNTPQPDELVRALAHDMRANFLLLEHSFSQLKKSLGDLSGPPAAERDVRDRTAHVEACLDQAGRFLDDLGQLGRAGTVDMQPEPVELAAVVDAALFEQQHFLAERGVAVEIRRPLPAVRCHAERLKQVVTNLLRNAACHGCDPAEPRITIAPVRGPHDSGAVWKGGQAPCNLRKGESQDRTSGSPSPFPNSLSVAPADGHLAAFVVHDNGRPIDPRHREAIFLPGRRLATAGEGSGMGLAIVRRIVEHFGGSITLDADCQSGNSFVVCLPAAELTPSVEATSVSPEPREVFQLDGHHPQLGPLHRDLRLRPLKPGCSSRRMDL